MDELKNGVLNSNSVGPSRSKDPDLTYKCVVNTNMTARKKKSGLHRGDLTIKDLKLNLPIHADTNLSKSNH